MTTTTTTTKTKTSAAPAAAAPGPYEQARPHRAGYRDLSPEATYAARGRARIIDVREAQELRADGSVPGSEHVPLATLEAVARGWDRDAELVLVCRSGGRSARAAEALVRLGFRRVMNMVGGMLAYAAAGLPIARS